MRNYMYHRLMRHILALLFCICVWGSNWPFALANEHHEEHFSHDEFLKEVLINPGITPSEQADEKLQMLQYASYLCIDQFNNNDPKKANSDQGKLDWLRERVNGLPQSINEFNPDLGGKQLSGTNHRSFTHRGWGFPYWVPGNGGDIAKSKLRMKIMQNTVQTVFGFQLKSDSKIIGWAQSLINKEYDNEKMDAFCRLIYYVHVLGDCIEDENFKQANGQNNGQKIPLGRVNPNPNHTIEDTDIISELLDLLPVLVNNNSFTYPSMMQDLQLMQDKINKLYSRPGGISSAEAYREYHQLSCDLKEILTTYIPNLLFEETFFRNAFYK